MSGNVIATLFITFVLAFGCGVWSLLDYAVLDDVIFTCDRDESACDDGGFCDYVCDGFVFRLYGRYMAYSYIEQPSMILFQVLRI